MTVAHNMPDIILVEKAIRKWTIIDIAVTGDFNVVRIEDWKVDKYQYIYIYIYIYIYSICGKSCRDIHSTSCRALGTVPKRLISSIDLLDIDYIASTQMTTRLGTAGILCSAMNL